MLALVFFLLFHPFAGNSVHAQTAAATAIAAAAVEAPVRTVPAKIQEKWTRVRKGIELGASKVRSKLNRKGLQELRSTVKEKAKQLKESPAGQVVVGKAAGLWAFAKGKGKQLFGLLEVELRQRIARAPGKIDLDREY